MSETLYGVFDLSNTRHLDEETEQYVIDYPVPDAVALGGPPTGGLYNPSLYVWLAMEIQRRRLFIGLEQYDFEFVDLTNTALGSRAPKVVLDYQGNLTFDFQACSGLIGYDGVEYSVLDFEALLTEFVTWACSEYSGGADALWRVLEILENALIDTRDSTGQVVWSELTGFVPGTPNTLDDFVYATVRWSYSQTPEDAPEVREQILRGWVEWLRDELVNLREFDTLVILGEVLRVSSYNERIMPFSAIGGIPGTCGVSATRSERIWLEGPFPSRWPDGWRGDFRDRIRIVSTGIPIYQSGIPWSSGSLSTPEPTEHSEAQHGSAALHVNPQSYELAYGTFSVPVNQNVTTTFASLGSAAASINATCLYAHSWSREMPDIWSGGLDVSDYDTTTPFTLSSADNLGIGFSGQRTRVKSTLASALWYVRNGRMWVEIVPTITQAGGVFSEMPYGIAAPRIGLTVNPSNNDNWQDPPDAIFNTANYFGVTSHIKHYHAVDVAGNAPLVVQIDARLDVDPGDEFLTTQLDALEGRFLWNGALTEHNPTDGEQFFEELGGGGYYDRLACHTWKSFGQNMGVGLFVVAPTSLILPGQESQYPRGLRLMGVVRRREGNYAVTYPNWEPIGAGEPPMPWE